LFGTAKQSFSLLGGRVTLQDR